MGGMASEGDLMRLTTLSLAAVLACGFLTTAWAAAGPAAPQDPEWTACDNGQDHDGSIAGCTRVIDRGIREPAAGRALAYRNRADAYYRKGDADRAMHDADEAIRLDPKLAAAYNTRGHAYLSKGDYDRAILDYSEAIRLDPKFANFHVNRGSTYYDKGDADRAIRDADEAIRLDPKSALAYHLRGKAYLGRHDYDRAIQDYGEAIRFSPGIANYYVDRGALYGRKGDVDRAIRDANEAIRLDPKHVAAYDVRGTAYFHKHEYDHAIQDYDEAIRLDPIDARAFAGRGAAYREKGDLGRAMTELEASIRINPNLPRTYFHRGLIFELSGDRDRAMADLRHALELEKNEAFALEAREALARIETKSGGQVSATSPTSAVPAPPAPERRVALVVGNADYKAVAALPNPRRDAEAVAAALRGVGFEVTLATDLPRDQLVDALRSFAAASEKADWAVIYYAGHGIELGGVNYLVPVDARLVADRDVQFEAVPLDQALGAVEGARKLRMVLLDACRENPFARQMQRTLAARSVGRGLARIEPGPGTLVAYAARDGQVALDGDGQNSPFATALVKLLKRPGLEVNKLFRLVHDDVMDATGNRQEPYTYGALPGREDFFFVAR
ncbi:MAG: tetratricopeptide repeat protein [Xanthobacteraceae bacterium]